MPFEVMDQRGVSDPSNFFDDISFHSERNVGLRKQIYMNAQHPQGMNGTPGSILSASSPFEVNAKSGFPMSRTQINSSEQSVKKLPFGGEQDIADLMKGSKESLHYNPQSWSDKYGELRNIYTSWKHRGFVMISYFDLRAAQKAMQALQSRPLRTRKLDIHYSLPKDNASEKDIGHGTLMLTGLDSSILNEELKHIFGFYGEIKEIYEYPEINHLKFIEFYDMRAAEEALRALNRIEIAGKQIKLEPGHPRFARWW